MNVEQSKQIFLIAIEQHPPDQWSRYLDQACGTDRQLRQEVQRLLEAHLSDGSLLDIPAVAPPATLDRGFSEKIGRQIGPYKLLQEIGEGGMGIVYLAEQQQPVKRRVALKIIKPGMDSRQIIARFEAERQALAMMDHPNIAKVLDAGATEFGRPYFVMELVNGVSVTKYCDEHQLTARERLELFVPICLAVQHAHQKGIIHRDLKPSNILIALYDGLPVPKIIDFGVSKATLQTLTDKTLFTQLGQVIGTLEYMSPEQAERNQLDIDTRSDIYSLGVVLYELLTGETPFDQLRLRSAAFEEVLRIIREEEPPRPSTKLGNSAALQSIAARRRIEPQKLSLLVRGELDWIVMKALEKDRGRRYETASKFAEDLQHYLNDDPVVACPPSTAYRFRKFARRNKTVIAGAGIVVAALLIGLFGTSWQAIRATRAENKTLRASIRANRERDLALAAELRAESETANAKGALKFLAEVLEQAAPYREPDRELKVRTLLDRAADRLENKSGIPVLVEAAIRQTLGRIYWGLGEFELAETQLARAYAQQQEHAGAEHLDSLNAAYDLAMLYWIQSDFTRAEPLFMQVYNGKNKEMGADHPETLRAVIGLGLIYVFRDEPDRAEQLFAAALKGRSTPDSPPDPLKLLIKRGLGLTYLLQEKYDQAEPLLTQVYQNQLRLAGGQHPETLITMAMLSGVYLGMKRLDEAEKLALETYHTRKSVFGIFNPHTLSSIGVLARVHLANGRWNDAEPLLQILNEQGQAQRERLPPFTIWEIGDVGLALLHEQKFKEAKHYLQLYLDVASQKFPRGWRLGSIQSALGACLMDQQEFAEAERLLRLGYDTLQNHKHQIPATARQKRLDEAAKRLEQLHRAREMP